jgi:hypothetical protein
VRKRTDQAALAWVNGRMRIPLAPIHATGIIVLLVAILPELAVADGLDDSLFSFGGFGTLGLVHSSEHQADFATSLFRPNGAGYTHDWSLAVDSLAAAQITANFTPRLSAVVQVLAQQNYNETYTATAPPT